LTERWTLFFEPLDVLQFRDHKPFDAGFHVLAQSVFPGPSVFLGCLRTALFREAGADFERRDEQHFGLPEGWKREWLGSRSTPGTLSLRGPLLAIRDGEGPEGVTPLFKPPLDLVPLKKKDRAASPTHCPTCDAELKLAFQVLTPWERQKLGPRRFHWRGGLQPDERALPWTGLDVEKGGAGELLLRPTGAARWRDARSDEEIVFEPGDVVHSSCVYKHEDRVGIARDLQTLTTEERMFYVKRPFRLAQDCGFAVDVEVPGGEGDRALDALDGQVVPLGGKAHRARIHVSKRSLWTEHLKSATAPGGRLKVCLVTSLVLSEKLTEWPAGIRCGVTDRADPVGGYDLAKREPKPLRRVLPAGTVLHLEGLGVDEALAALGGEEWNMNQRAGHGAALVTSL